MRKKLLLGALFAVATPLLANAYNVDTEVKTKNLLMEDFTGWSCSNCPAGHEIMDRMVWEHDNIIPLAIHCGRYSAPAPGYADLRTPEGYEIWEYFEPDGYPKGMISRIKSGGIVLRSSSDWVPMCRTYSKQKANVNLYATATGDAATRKLNIHVEGYYTGKPTGSTNYLCVALTQDDIIAPQLDGTTMLNSYHHNNVLRQYISDVWGDPFTAEKETYFEKDYSITVPEKHYGLDEGYSTDYELADLNVIVYVLGEEKINVQNVIKVKPTFTGLEVPFQFEVEQPKFAVDTKYGFRILEARLRNRSLEEATSAVFNLNINKKDYEVAWSGSVAPNSRGDITLDVPDEVVYEEPTFFSISIKSVNGKNVVTSTSVDGAFYSPVTTTPTINWEITTDLYANENTYTIRDSKGNVVKELGPFEDGYIRTYYGTEELEPNSNYCLEVLNLWGASVKNGTLVLKDEAGVDVTRLEKLPFFGGRIFFTTNNGAGINDIAGDDNTPARYYNLHGMEIDESAITPGIYIVKQGGKASLKAVK